MKEKKILLYLGNAYFINGRVGVGMYQSNIINGLIYEYDIVVPSDIKNVYLPEKANKIILKKHKKLFISLFRFILPVSFFFKDYDYVITDSNSFHTSRLYKTKIITIVHDCMSLIEKNNYSIKQKIFAKLSFNSLKYSSFIVAVSQSTKQSIHDLIGIPYNKIKVVTNITNFYVTRNEKKHFIYIGDMRPNKNLISLIYGYNEYIKNKKNPEKLIIAGRKLYEYEKLKFEVDKLNLNSNIIFLGYITEEEKKQLYENALALIFLSNNEGFGIPLIEAAVNGIPVLCSDIPIFHEVLTEEYALFVDNSNIYKIAESLDLIKDKEISEESKIKIKNKFSKETFNLSFNKLFEDD